jgi:predicted nucleotidyltransferase
MISQETIQQVVDDIVKGVDPVKVILFGSCARGTQSADSDLDIFVVAEMEGSSAE